MTLERTNNWKERRFQFDLKIFCCDPCKKASVFDDWFYKCPDCIYVSRKDLYRALYQRQKGKCAICFKPPAPGKRLYLDHNHASEIYRGLLCPRCNTGIGIFQENTEILSGAIRYLEEYAHTKPLPFEEQEQDPSVSHSTQDVPKSEFSGKTVDDPVIEAIRDLFGIPRQKL